MRGSPHICGCGPPHPPERYFDEAAKFSSYSSAILNRAGDGFPVTHKEIDDIVVYGFQTVGSLSRTFHPNYLVITKNNTF